MGAGETLPVPGVVPVGHSALGDHLATLDALCREFFLVAFGAVDVMLLGYEGLCADGVLAGAADEALLVPLPRLVLHLLHPRLEDVPASVAPRGELGVVAGAAVDPVRLGAELFVHQAAPTLVTQETGLVPVLLLVGKILRVNPNDLAALVTGVGEDVLVTFDAVRMVISEDIPGQERGAISNNIMLV